ncbi:hypothetical protein DL770_006176 [Monosporascus sp. CRB-9-2]|nr:hypothetical protein DL770_006176 [Monosporascus sp. CRB-9-2]
MIVLSTPGREGAQGELFTIKLDPGVTRVGRRDVPVVHDADDGGQSPVSKLSTANMRNELTTFWGFYNRYYTSSYGKQASDWLLGEFQSVSLRAATRASVKAFKRSSAQNSIISAIPERPSSEVVVVGAHLDFVNGRIRSGRSPGAITAGQRANALEFHWYVGEEAGLLGSGDIFDSYRASGAVVRVITAAGHGGCGYGCSGHASATPASYPSAFVIEAAMSRMSPYIHMDWDPVSTLNFPHMLEHAKLAVGYAYELTFASILGKGRARTGEGCGGG